MKLKSLATLALMSMVGLFLTRPVATSRAVTEYVNFEEDDNTTDWNDDTTDRKNDNDDVSIIIPKETPRVIGVIGKRG